MGPILPADDGRGVPAGNGKALCKRCRLSYGQRQHRRPSGTWSETALWEG